MRAERLEIRPVAGALGAEVLGVDLAEPLGNETFATIHQAFHDHSVIFFRDQDLTPEQHRGFAARFGKLEPHPFVKGMNGIPEIIEIIKEADEAHNWGGSWHADVTFKKEPSIGAVLYGRDVPSHGGDTLFGNMYLAYELLSDGMKKTLDALNAVHWSGEPQHFYTDFKSMKAQASPEEAGTAVHPVVRTHPVTGRKALFVNRAYTRRFENMTEEESRPVLNYLFEQSTRPELTCRFRWAVGSIAVWDNRVTLHHAMDDDFRAMSGAGGFRRVLHRATLAGERPI